MNRDKVTFVRASDQRKGSAETALAPALDPAEIARHLKGGRLPPVQLWHPERQGVSEMRILRDGSWLHQGRPINRQAMVRLFSTVLRHDDDGIHYLVTPAEMLSIGINDAPFVAVEMTVHGANREQILVFRTNVDDEVMAGPEHPIHVVFDTETGEPSPYVLVRDRLEALIARSVFYDLIELAVEVDIAGERQFGLWSAGIFFPIVRAVELEEC